MERPLADSPTAHLWRTLFALVVELSIRSGLVTEHDLVPAGPVDTRQAEVPNAEEGEELQEQGEESADEHDPIVEFAPEPDAETEPRASNDGRPLTELPHAATCQVMEAAPCAATTDYTAASSTASGIGEAVSERVQYPVEYDPFDRPVEEVVMNLFEGDPPANTPPTKRRKGNDQWILKGQHCLRLLCVGTDEFTWAEGSSYSSGGWIAWAMCSGSYSPP